jgi:hypothetical protein
VAVKPVDNVHVLLDVFLGAHDVFVDLLEKELVGGVRACWWRDISVILGHGHDKVSHELGLGKEGL